MSCQKKKNVHRYKRLSKKQKRNVIILSIVILFVLLIGWISYITLLGKINTDSNRDIHIVIDADDDIDSVRYKIETIAKPSTMMGFNIMVAFTDYADNIKQGKYKILPGMRMHALFLNLKNGRIDNSSVRVIITERRTVDEIWQQLSKQLSVSIDDLKEAANDSTFLAELGFTKETLPAMIIPNTYEFKPKTDAKSVLRRLKKEYDAFWNKGRQAKAKDLNMSQVEVSILASIVDSETKLVKDKPIIAGLYLNRLRIHMKLQSDPTVIFALGDFTIKRVLNKHLSVESPYNTYKYEGLPPGPIRISSISAIDAVLDPDNNDYLYMCAKETLNGEHYFTSSASEHAQNARKYANALNQLKIK